ncbi:MAG: hypothetical protein D6813_12490 [Calditrichaeota bacterium]|nr:MAG: hypothetical protein D6813_12490 [Calditrichota bacterium]
MSKVNTCVDRSIGDTLKLLEYSFSGSSPEQQQRYRQHLQNCLYCRTQRKKILLRKRIFGISLTLIGLLLIGFTVWTTKTSSKYKELMGWMIYFLILGITLVLQGVNLLRGKPSARKQQKAT